MLILENWLQFETSAGGIDCQGAKHVRSKLPKRVKKRRQISTGKETTGFEEYFDFIFPDDQSQAKNLKILELANKWKKE